jgi:4-oxalocrotonate tautomerase
MPLIQVRVIKDVFSKEQKRQIITKLTDAMVSIEGENVRGYTLCLVEEVESGDWGVGGNALTTADVHAAPTCAGHPSGSSFRQRSGLA